MNDVNVRFPFPRKSFGEELEEYIRDIEEGDLNAEPIVTSFPTRKRPANAKRKGNHA